MNCKDFEELISPYLDNELDDVERLSFAEHLGRCKACSDKYQKVLKAVSLCRNLEDLQLPDDFTQKLMGRIDSMSRESSETEITGTLHERVLGRFKKLRGFYWKAIAGIAALFLFVIFIGYNYNFFNLGMQQKSGVEEDSFRYFLADESETKKSLPFEGESSSDGNISQSSVSSPRERKVIKTAHIEIEVENLDENFNAVADMAEKMGGYIEYSRVWTSITTAGERKMSNIVLRIPEENFGEALRIIEGIGEVKSRSLLGDDKTLEYIDLQARLRNLMHQEERLLEVLEKAKNVQEILEVMREITRIRADIESMTAQIKSWDNLVQYSTININMMEVNPSKQEIDVKGFSGLWSRTVKGFISTVNQIINLTAWVVVFIGTISPILILFVLGFVVYKLLFRKRKSGTGDLKSSLRR